MGDKYLALDKYHDVNFDQTNYNHSINTEKFSLLRVFIYNLITIYICNLDTVSIVTTTRILVRLLIFVL